MEKRSIRCSSCSQTFEIELKSKTLSQVATCPKCLNKFTFDPTKQDEIPEKKIETPKIKNIVCPSCSKGFGVRVPSNIDVEQIFTTCPSCNLRFNISRDISKPIHEQIQKSEETKGFDRVEQKSDLPKFEEETKKDVLYSEQKITNKSMEGYEKLDIKTPPKKKVEHKSGFKNKFKLSFKKKSKEKIPSDEHKIYDDFVQWHEELAQEKDEIHWHEGIEKDEVHWHEDFLEVKYPAHRKPKSSKFDTFNNKLKNFQIRISKPFKKSLNSIKNFDIHHAISSVKESLNPKNLKKNIKTKTGFAGVLLLIVFILGIIFVIYGTFEVFGTDSFEESSNKTGSIAGIVRDENGEEIEGAYVLILSKNGKFQATTNKDGWYRIKDIPIGYHTIIASKENYGGTTMKNVKIEPSETTQIETVDFELSYVKNKTITLEKEDNLQKNSAKCMGIIFIFSIFSLLGSILVLQKKSFKLTSICAIAGILTYGFLIGSILGMVALILILSSKEDFE